jgi:uncharacterized membrane protein
VLHAKSVQSTAKRVRDVVNRDRRLVAVLTWLGTLGGDYSEANGVSADGAVVVGLFFDNSGVACLSLDGVGWDARPRHAGRR